MNKNKAKNLINLINKMSSIDKNYNYFINKKADSDEETDEPIPDPAAPPVPTVNPNQPTTPAAPTPAAPTTPAAPATPDTNVGTVGGDPELDKKAREAANEYNKVVNDPNVNRAEKDRLLKNYQDAYQKASEARLHPTTEYVDGNKGGGAVGRSGGGGGGGGGGDSSTIKKMQSEIKSFADAMTTYKTVKTRGADGKVIETVDMEDKRKDFNDFLAEQYSAGSNIKGEEWTTDINATTRESKLPTGIIELDNVIDGLRRIGPRNKESIQEGIWDWRTQNALKNVWAIADALVRVTDDFGAKLRNPFTNADLQALGQAIPKTNDISTYPLASKIASAKTISPLINKLTNFYKEYYSIIIESPEYSPYIKQDRPLINVKPGGVDPGSIPADLRQNSSKPGVYSLYYVTVAGPKGPVTLSQIDVSYLSSKAKLQEFMLRLGYSNDEIYDNKKISNVLKSIDDHLKIVPT